MCTLAVYNKNKMTSIENNIEMTLHMEHMDNMDNNAVENDKTDVENHDVRNTCESSPDEQRVNHEICTNLKHYIGQAIIATLAFVAITYFLIYVYTHLGDIAGAGASALGKAITVIFNAIGTCLFYYTMYGIRALAIIMTGVGSDIVSNVCTSSWPIINTRYISAFKLDKNIDYTHTPAYYDFCTKDTYTVLYTFLIGHLSIMICVVVVTIFCSCDLPVYQTYMNMVNHLNSSSSSSSSSSTSPSSPSSSYEYLYEHLYRRKLKPMNFRELNGFSAVTGTIVYIVLSGINYILRIKGYDNVYYINLPVFLIGMFITKLTIPFIALKCTPFQDDFYTTYFRL